MRGKESLGCSRSLNIALPAATAARENAHMGSPINIFDQSASRNAYRETQLTALSELTGSMSAIGVMARGITENLDNQEFLGIPDSVKEEAMALFEIVSEVMPTLVASIAEANHIEGIDEFAAAGALSIFVEQWDDYFHGGRQEADSDSDDIDEMFEQFLNEDCGNPNCLVHGVGGIASDLRDLMSGFNSADDMDEYPFNFGRNGYTKRQQDFITGQADSPGCGDPDCEFCNARPGFASQFEEVDLNDVEPDSPLGREIQALANAGINIAGARVYAGSAR